jgi:predicted transcriptional regulator
VTGTRLFTIHGRTLIYLAVNEGQTVREMADALDRNGQSVHRELKALEDEGLVTATTRTRYKPGGGRRYYVANPELGNTLRTLAVLRECVPRRRDHARR